MRPYDLVIIGGGPAGYSCALRGAQLNASIALIEDRKLGGTCLNRGCIPTKVLYQGVKSLQELRKSDAYGLYAGEVDLTRESKINIDKLLDFKEEKVTELVEGIDSLLKSRKVDVILGKGCLKSDNVIEVEENTGEKYTMTSKTVVLATGSKPNEKIMGPELSAQCWWADDLVAGREFWENSGQEIAIIGGGVIGVELSTILSILGKKVTLIEVESRLLPPFDTDIKKRIGTHLKKLGINVHTNSVVYDIISSEDNTKRKLAMRKKEKEITMEVDDVILSVGREPNFSGIDVENLGLDIRHDYILTDYKMKTNLKNVYAAGDIVTKGPQLAHVATHQGKVAAENALNFGNSYFDDTAVPNCVFSFPQIAEVGFSEQECKTKEIPYKVGKFNFRSNAKAMIMQEEGFVKIISDVRTDEILGMHIIGPNASDLIQEGTVAVKHKLKSDELIKTIHPHPTLSEAIWEAGLDLNDKALHQISLRK